MLQPCVRPLCDLAMEMCTQPLLLHNTSNSVDQGLSRYLETGCPNRGFIDFCVSKVWYKIHTTNKIDPIPLQILLL